MFKVVVMSVALVGMLACSDNSESSATFEQEIILSFSEGMSRSEYQQLASDIVSNHNVRKVRVDHESNEIKVTLVSSENESLDQLIHETATRQTTSSSKVEIQKNVIPNSDSESGYDKTEGNEGETFNITDIDFFSIFRNPLQ